MGLGSFFKKAVNWGKSKLQGAKKFLGNAGSTLGTFGKLAGKFANTGLGKSAIGWAGNALGINPEKIGNGYNKLVKGINTTNSLINNDGGINSKQALSLADKGLQYGAKRLSSKRKGNELTNYLTKLARSGSGASDIKSQLAGLNF